MTEDQEKEGLPKPQTRDARPDEHCRDRKAARLFAIAKASGGAIVGPPEKRDRCIKNHPTQALAAGDRPTARPAPATGRILLGDSTRGTDPNLQRLANPPPGFCEIDMVAHSRTSVAGSFIQTLTMVDIATGWTECLPLAARDGSLVVEAMTRAQGLFPWLIRGADFDNDSAFMNDVVVPWRRAQKIEVTRSRAYKKNDQAFVEQKNGAVVRRLVGYGRFDGIETAHVMARLDAAARLHVNFFQPSFKLKEKRREGAKVIKRYHPPATPYERALAHPKLARAIKRRLRETYRTLDPVQLLAEIRAAQEELGERIGKRGLRQQLTAYHPLIRWRLLDRSARRPRPPKCEPHIAGRNGDTKNAFACLRSSYLVTIKNWFAVEPQITALTIVRRLATIDPSTLSDKQHSIAQRQFRSFRQKVAETIIASMSAQPMTAPGMRTRACGRRCV